MKRALSLSDCTQIHIRRCAFAAALVALSALRPPFGLQAQVTRPDPMRGMPMGDSSKRPAPHMSMFEPLGVSMDRMGSGTSWLPDATPLPSLHTLYHGWDVSGHGFVFVQEDIQGGPRGGSQFGSLNWGMLMASREVAHGRLQARTMLSLDPLTVTPRGYPLLLQSGESYHGVPLHDRQHPHDFLMELGALYERPVSGRLGVSLYAAPSGEPALGPVAFMHRPSAMDIPTAPISHHWQDATHITFGVLSAGVFARSWKLEGSTFNGREPDDHRWDIDPIRLDSYSGRLTLNPTMHWSFTAGYGYIHSPEAANPRESLHRLVASALYGRRVGHDGRWSAAAVWGANKPQGQSMAHSILGELETVLDPVNTVMARAEWVQKSAEDLVLGTPTLGFAPDRRFNVGETSLGYIREVMRFGRGTLGVGAMGTVNYVPAVLTDVYGSRHPRAALFFLRWRPSFGTDATLGGGMQHMDGPHGL